MKRTIISVMCLLCAAMGLGGCGSAGALSVRSAALDNTTTIQGNFDTAIYAVQDAQTLHVLLIDGPVDAPRQVVHIQMFWAPMAGKTPFDASATNASVRYIVFDGDKIGCYGGGGLLRPRQTPGDSTFHATLHNATLRLLSAGEGFENTLGVAVAEGSFTAQRDDEKTLELVRKFQTMVSEKLGYPKMVMAVSGR
ncbi:MAG: hypothetical protein ACYC26_06440 [Phycisphaerales bacterium]